MKPVKILVLTLLAIGLIGYNLPPTQADTTSVDTKPTDTNTQNIADLKAVEDRFMTAFRAKDVNAIMELCVPDESLVVFDVSHLASATEHRPTAKIGKKFSAGLKAHYRPKSVT